MKGKTPKQPGGLHTNEYKNDSRLLENIASQMTVRNIFIVQKEVGKKKKKLSILILCLGRAPFKNEGEIQTIQDVQKQKDLKEPITSRHAIKKNSLSNRRKMILNGNLDLSKGMKRSRNSDFMGVFKRH